MNSDGWEWRLEGTLALLRIAGCGLAIWAANRNRAWIGRAIVVLGCAWGLVALNANSQSLMLLVQVATVMAATFIRQPGRISVRFPLRDLFAVTALLGAFLALFDHWGKLLHSPDWISAVERGVLQGLFAASLMWLAESHPDRRSLQWSCWAVVVTGALACWGMQRFQWPLRLPDNCRQALAITAWGEVRIVGATILGSLVLLTRYRWPGLRVANDRPRRRERILVGGAVGAMCVWCGYLAYRVAMPPALPLASNPAPAHLSLTLSRAAEQVRGLEYLSATVPPGIEVDRELVAKNREACDLAQASVAEVDRQLWPPDLVTVSEPTRSLRGVSALARVLQIRAHVEAADGEWNAVARTRLLLIRLGAWVRHGGLFVHSQLGCSLEMTGRSPGEVWRRIDYPTRAVLLRELIQIDETRESAAAVVARDRIRNLETLGVEAAFADAVCGPAFWGDDQRWVERRHADTGLRLLIADLAIRQFDHDHQRLPDSLAELAPAYVPGLLSDAYAGIPLIYRRERDSFVLYSCGPDGHDDGGLRTTTSDLYLGRPCDVFLETAQQE